MVMTALVMQECARPTEFSEVFDRMQQEHEELSLLLLNLKVKATEASGGSHSFRAVVSLKQSTSLFMNRFEDHLQWGKSELFPMIGVYTGKSFESSIMPLISDLGKNYDHAVRSVNAFLNLAGTVSMVEAPELLKATWSNLLQAMVILTDYLEMEKNKVFPLADQILTDIDYLFS